MLGLIFVSQTAFANWNSPNRMFDMTKNTNEKINLTVTVVKNIQQTCREESLKRLGKAFDTEVDACAFWKGSKCTIFVPRNMPMKDLGHEVLHCLQGHWH